MIGTKLAHYEITLHLGSGGMGDVYQATDSKLGRSVAIKLLPEAFARDAERVSRFEREARLLASLNHPNIAAIHGIEDSGGRKFLVMELVPGETLAERTARGAIPLDESLAVAKQIAEALEAAHEKGVIHRDLKPANVKITPDGQVKVLDFGLAKAYEQDTMGANMSNSPTMASMGATNPGVILGTAAYMSPEQAKGRNVDRRTDIFAFGCVLYEMLTGHRAFDGEDIAEILSRVLQTEPDWAMIPASVPPRVQELLKLCLRKSLKSRRDSATDVRIDIEQALLEPETPSSRPSGPRRSPLLMGIAAALLLSLLAVAGTATYFIRTAEKPALITFDIQPPERMRFAGITATPAVNSGAISPDGRTLAFTAQDSSGVALLWLRELASRGAHSLPGTDGALLPFWSPDGGSIGFFAQGALKTTDVTSGSVRTLAETPTSSRVGASWGPDGTILFSRGPTTPLYALKSAGGETVATKQSGVFPSFMPDGRHFVYKHMEDSGIYVGSLDSPESKRLLTADSARYAQPGFLLFVQQGSLMAQALDLSKLELTGTPIHIADSIPAEWSAPAFSASTNGVLVYRAVSGLDHLQLAWFDRSGKPVERIGTPGGYAGIDLSPDGKRVALHRHEGAGGDVWTFDSASGATTRVTFNASQDNSMPVWSPDGLSIVFASLRKGKWGLYRKAAGATEGEELLWESDLPKSPFSWSPDGKWIVAGVMDPKSSTDLWLLPMTGERKPAPLLNSLFSEVWGQVSADGKWFAYCSNETGRYEVYVRQFPAGDSKWQISKGGGSFPRWRADGKELFFEVTEGGELAVVAVGSTGPTFQVGVTQELFDARGAWNAPAGHTGNFHVYAVSLDGQRFLIPRPAADLEGGTTSTPITVVVNWLEKLKQSAPVR